MRRPGRATKLNAMRDELLGADTHAAMHRRAVFCADPPAGSSDAAIEFLERGHDLVHFVGMFFLVPERLDETLRTLLGGEQHPAELIRYTDVAEHYRSLALELVVIRSVDLYLTYLAQLMRTVLEAEPRALRSHATRELDWILSHATMEELTRHLIDEEVQRLSLAGFAALDSAFSERLGLPLAGSGERGVLQETIEMRNVLVHEHAIVSDTYVRRVPWTNFSVGDRLTVDDANARNVRVAEAVLDLDLRARTKFLVPSANRPSPPRMCHRL